MMRHSVLAWFLPLAALLGACQSTVAGSGDTGDPGSRVAGEYLVQLDQGLDPRPILERAFGRYGLEGANRLEVERVIYRIRLDRDPGLEALKERIKSHPGIRSIQPNFRYSIPNPPGREPPSPPPADRAP